MVDEDRRKYFVSIQKNHNFAACKGNSQHGGHAAWRKINTK
jgi:hypothetical protein